VDDLTQEDRNDLKELIGKYKEIIGKMPEEMFTSHQFILELARENQRLYVGALNRYADSETPFRTLHGLLSRALNGFKEDIERVAEEVPSEDIFRKLGRCAVWRKIGQVSPKLDQSDAFLRTGLPG